MTAGKIILDMVAERPDLDEKFFFIFGVPKSGTTWLQMLLNQHPNIFCRSEDQFMFFINTVPQMLTDYNKVLFRTDNKTARQGPTLCENQDAEQGVAAIIRMILAKSLTRPGITRVGAKDNAIIQTLPLFSRIFTRSRFVFIVRDPRDVIVSSWFHNLRVEENFMQRAVSMEIWTRKMTGRWYKDISHVRRESEKMKDRFITVRYEDMHLKPLETATQLFEFLDLDHDESLVSRCVDLASFNKLSGGRELGAESRDSFYRKGVVGDWKNHLDQSMNEIVLEGAGSVMMTFDYH